VAKAPTIFGLIPTGGAVLAFGTTGGVPHFFTTTNGTVWRPLEIK
jgi:hypothetical protein